MSRTRTAFQSIARTIARGVATVALVATTAASLTAQPISFLFKGTAIGELNGTGFRSTAFSVAINTDISNLGVINTDTPAYNNLSGTIDLGGLGTFSFIQPIYVFLNSGILGFGTLVTGDLISMSHPAFVGYNFTSSIGPVSKPGPYSTSQFVNAATTGGPLTFATVTDYSIEAVVGTQVVPEPATFAFVGLGLGGVAVAYRRRRV